MIRSATARDSVAIVDIYNHYILNTVITFEEQVISAGEMSKRMADVSAAHLPWLVAEQDGQVVGYAYANTWKTRYAYRFTVEITVYLAPDYAGRGLGSGLYQALITQLRALGIHVVLGCIALPNSASVALHEKFGLKKVAHFNEVGFKFNRWLDVGYWQANLATNEE